MSKFPDECYVFLDMRELPQHPDGSDNIVPLSPITITWGNDKPWETPTPSVLTMDFFDPTGRVSMESNKLNGHRLTVNPWTNRRNEPVCFAVFDGYITDVKINGRKITVTASDRLYILATDVRQGPNWGTDASTARGYQWWTQGSLDDKEKGWSKYDGLNDVSISYSSFAVPFEASERVSFLDLYVRRKTIKRADGAYELHIARPIYVNLQGEPEAVPRLSADYDVIDPTLRLLGATIENNNGTDISSGEDPSIIPASTVEVPVHPSFTSPDDVYTQLEIKYFHRGLTNPGATAAQTEEAATKYTFTQDGARLVRVDESNRDGETVLSLDIAWTEYPSNPDSTASKIDMNIARKTLQELNTRVRLPNVTFQNDRNDERLFYPRPSRLCFIGSQYERTIPLTHGWWTQINGKLVYDATRKSGRWRHTVGLLPVISSGSEPTFGDLQQLNSEATFSEANWILGATRYITDIRKVAA
jgi:hypothetical protein